ncbi:MAG: Fic family protein [Kiritimatiellales bacterium]
MNDTFPRLEITPLMVSLVAEICEALGRMHGSLRQSLQLRRINRIKTVQASLQIEGNCLTVEQVTAVLDGKTVLAPAKDIQEVRNAIAAYEKSNSWHSNSIPDLLDAHRILMFGLIDRPGEFRPGTVGIQGNSGILHIAPPAHLVPELMEALFAHLRTEEIHPLLNSCIFHYEFEFIHPFSDGNGRLGRLWQTLMLQEFNPVFAFLPVENMIRDRQQLYYNAINQANAAGNAAPFVEFMLGTLRDSVREAATHQVTNQVTHQVKILLRALQDGLELSSSELLHKLKLSDRVNLRQRYLVPALAAGWIEYTIPEAPKSRNQKYRITAAGYAAAGGK